MKSGKRFVLLLATGFGLGLSPVASGTTGSLPGIVLAGALLALRGLPGAPWLEIAAVVMLTLLAIPICDVAEKHYGKKDDGRIVADEWLTFPLCLVGLPWAEHLWILPMAFVVARVMDILKPAPARQSQAIRGGTGIVLDDAIAGVYALVVNHALAHVLLAL